MLMATYRAKKVSLNKYALNSLISVFAKRIKQII
jgi:hypothetical protein